MDDVEKTSRPLDLRRELPARFRIANPVFDLMGVLDRELELAGQPTERIPGADAQRAGLDPDGAIATFDRRIDVMPLQTKLYDVRHAILPRQKIRPARSLIYKSSYQGI
ncbi:MULTISPECIES: hypothetical protein [Bradyrhizobium]|uniref:hypothetical protein n=1 Tax=Bradyrhizobium TaxID=374 RepID=UPI001EDA7AA5|nr:hypothetical protein [Bradyrhizobium zhengyangense]MCG2642814.1 hypothetical protein [Bradyrhizobium zhengyangense]